MYREMTRALGVWLSMACVSCFGMGGAWASDDVNAVLGNESWVAAHGVEPRAGTGEVARIQTHLRFAAERLEHADVQGLSSAQRVNRARALTRLSVYIEEGMFPQRDEGDGWQGRRPQFIDSRGVPCAVAAMIWRTGHRDLARRIDREHEFSFVPDIDTPGLQEWANEYGFSVRELAMIQPSYGYRWYMSESEKREYIRTTPQRMLERDMTEWIEACGAPDRVPLQLAFVLDPGGGQGATLRAISGSAFAKCAAERNEEKIRVHVADNQHLFQRGPMRIDVVFGKDHLERYTQNKLDAEDMGWRTTGCVPHQGVTTFVQKVGVTIRSTEDAPMVEVTSTPPEESFEGCIEAYVRRVFAEPLRLGLGPDVVMQRDYVLNDGSGDARYQALLARLLPEAWVPEEQDVAAVWFDRLMAGLVGLLTLIVGGLGFVTWRSPFDSASADTNAEDGHV